MSQSALSGGSVKRICVFCGSHIGSRDAYSRGAVNLGRALAQRDLELVYGGASIGVMGVVADTVIAAGGTATGIIPQSLVDKEIAHQGLTELRVVETMHERKATMAELSDGFIALPGGIGTLEELFEILTFAQLGFHRKPCGLLNIEGYYDCLLDFLEHAVRESFVGEAQLRNLQVDAEANHLLDSFEASLSNESS